MKEATSPVSLRPDEVNVTTPPVSTNLDNENELRRQRISGAVTLRAFITGVLFAGGLAWFNCWMALVKGVHSMGGIQMPFGAVFALLVLILFVNLPLKKLGIKPFRAPELLTVYVMTLFGGMLSTPGTDNQFMTMGSTLFYFQTPENGWAKLFYQHVPTWFAPGWDGKNPNMDVINAMYLGGVNFKDIPWTAWIPTLSAWGIFMLMVYGLLFFMSLMFRKQWVEREALAFPLIQLPLQMVDVDHNSSAPPSAAFWANRMMWLGFGLAATLHLLKGLNAHYADWPNVPLNAGGLGIPITFTEKPWNAIPKSDLKGEVYLGAIGVAYLLTREVSFSFWFFYVFILFQYAFAEMIGIPLVGLNKVGMASRPEFIIYQGVGGWVAMAAILCWTVRGYIGKLAKLAFTSNKIDEDEPFSPRFVVFGFLFMLIGLLVWSWFAGINVMLALVFLAIYMVTSIVITRLVIEGGFFFPQQPYYSLEWMTNGMFGGAAIGAASLTKLSFLQAQILVDTRTNVMPAFMHAMKIADEMRMDRQSLRRLLYCVVAAIVVTMGVTFVATLHGLYSTQESGLGGYDWFTKGGPTAVLTTTKAAIDNIDNPAQSGFRLTTLVWSCIGATVVWLMMSARSRFLWFPLHPLGYLLAPGYPITRLWFSFFLGWGIKSLIMKYGGSDTYSNVRPFMIGLILGNLAAMVLWVMYGFYSGTQVKYWTG